MPYIIQANIADSDDAPEWATLGADDIAGVGAPLEHASADAAAAYIAANAELAAIDPAELRIIPSARTVVRTVAFRGGFVGPETVNDLAKLSKSELAAVRDGCAYRGIAMAADSLLTHI